MASVLITYLDSGDDLTKRTISDWEIMDDRVVLAFCHLREDERSFSLSRIISVADSESGETYDNVYDFFGVTRPERPINNIKLLVAELLPAIKALRLLHAQLRPLKRARKKYYKPIVTFIRESAYIAEEFSDDDILDFVYSKVWTDRFDEGEYREYLANILPEHMASAQRAAFNVAKGSSRVVMDKEVREKIEKDFAL